MFTCAQLETGDTANGSRHLRVTISAITCCASVQQIYKMRLHSRTSLRHPCCPSQAQCHLAEAPIYMSRRGARHTWLKVGTDDDTFDDRL